ncbi:MAG: helix-turn-helix transcriptional regulator [Propionibacteriaceae bacterium]|jgi:DNA-binding CsgD family transcriptional regulator|nr:helix-turn-helix transcriptional regulator [Propionibacteriaceae bacterium]
MTAPGRDRLLTRAVVGSRRKYLGLALVLAWHYCLWFVPGTFPAMYLLDDRITFGWLIALAATVLTLFGLALGLGRTRHLPRSPVAIWIVAGAAAAATAALAVGCRASVGPVVAYCASAGVGVTAGLLWAMWGDRLACQRAQFTMRRLGPTYGSTLVAGLVLASCLPGVSALVFVALLPLASGLLLHASWRQQPRANCPPILPKQAARHGIFIIATVATISFVAAFVCYFTVAIVPLDHLRWGVGRSFTLGAVTGAVMILGIALLQRLVPSHPTVFRLYPWLVFAGALACLLCVLGAENVAFLLALAVSSVFEILLLMYMARTTLAGYTPVVAAFAVSGGAIRLGICLGNGTAIIYERTPGLPDTWTEPTLILFVAILAAVLIPLVRQEYAINDLARNPRDDSERVTVIDHVAEQFRLSNREKEIVGLLGRGYTAAIVAEKLVISPHTVNTHVQHIYEKLGIHKRSELITYLNNR